MSYKTLIKSLNWKKALVLGFFFARSLVPSVHAKECLIIDHDGAIDDLSAMIVALGASDKFDLRAVTIEPADSFKASALNSTKMILDRLGAQGVQIAISDLEGLHPFPDSWRVDSDRTEARILKLNLPARTNNPIVQETAPELLAKLLSQEKCTLILTGPLSNLAAALRINPDIQKNINQMYIMGGAVTEKGNVAEFADAGEWNFYNSPQDAHDVIHSSLSDRVILIALDGTKFVPISRRFENEALPIESFKSQGDRFLASRLAYEIWHIAFEDASIFELYHFWDTLTAVAAIRPETIRTEPMTIRVRTDAPYEGRTELVPEGQGVTVQVAVEVNFPLFERVLLESLRY